MVVRPEPVRINGIFAALPGLRKSPQVGITFRQKLQSVRIILSVFKDLPCLDRSRFVTSLVIQGNSLLVTIAAGTLFCCITAFGNSISDRFMCYRGRWNSCRKLNRLGHPRSKSCGPCWQLRRTGPQPPAFSILITFPVSKCTGKALAGEPAKGAAGNFRRTDKEPPPILKSVVKLYYHLLYQGRLEVKHHVPAEDDIDGIGTVQ